MINSREIFRISRLVRRFINIDFALGEMEKLGLLKFHKISTADAIDKGLLPADFTTQDKISVIVVSEKGEKIIKFMEDLKKEINFDSVKPSYYATPKEHLKMYYKKYREK